jgi:hypothetical protein
MYLGLPPRGLADLAREWWTDQESYASPLRARLSPPRLARMAGMYAGLRRAAR